MKAEFVHGLAKISRTLMTAAVLAASVLSVGAFPNIINVVETGGDNEATDTVMAKWTGVSFVNGVAGEFLDPFTVPLFGEDVPSYVDRAYQWNGARTDLPLSNYLAGNEYIMLGNDNKDNRSYRLQVTILEPSIVYVLVMQGISGAPNGQPLSSWTAMTWLATEGFAPELNGLNRASDPTLPDEVGLDTFSHGIGPGIGIANYFSVYSRRVPAGTFNLYQCEADIGGLNVYGVVVKQLTESLIRAVRPTPYGFLLDINDAGPVTMETRSLKVNFNGTDVTPAILAKTGDIVTAKYENLAAPMAPGSTNNLVISFTDSRGTNSTTIRQFMGVTYATVPASAAIPAASVDKNSSGFSVLVHQARSDAGLGANLDRAEGQIRGRLIDPTTGRPYENLVSGGPTFDAAYINWSQNAGGGTDIGRFTDVNGFPDEIIPGIPGLEGSTDNLASEIIGYAELKAGAYLLVVNSDEGFRVSMGHYVKSALSTGLGVFNGPRTSTDTEFWFTVPAAGIYPIRLVWFESGGAANVEFFAINDLGQRILLNDLADSTAIKVYKTATVPNVPIAQMVRPLPNEAGVDPATDVSIELIDQDSAVDVSTITLLVQGQAVTPTVSKSGTLTKMTYVNPALYAFDSTIPVKLTFKDTASPAHEVTAEYTFAIMGNVVRIPASYAKPVGSGLTPGMTARLIQSTAQVVSTAATEDRLKGVNPQQIIGFGLDTPQVVNYNQAAPAVFANNFGATLPFPGQGVQTDPNNLAMEVVTYLALNRGVYRLGINNDNGVRLTAGNVPSDIGVVLCENSSYNSAVNNIFSFLIETNGVYAFRLIFNESTGAACVQWYEQMVSGAFRLINDPNRSDAIKAYRFNSALPGSVALSQQPQSVTVIANQTSTFTVAATANSGSITNPYVFAYQWQRNQQDIPEANGPAYTTELLTPAESGSKYRCVVTLPGYPPVNSDEATLTVLPDATAPEVINIAGNYKLNTITLTFSERVNEVTASAPTSYTLSGGLIINSIAWNSITQSNVVLETGPQTPGAAYTLTIQDVTDLSNNPIVPVQKSFHAFVLDTGFLMREWYSGINGTATDDLMASEKFMIGTPDAVAPVLIAEAPSNIADNYGQRLFGFLIPPVNGAYTFYVAGDNGAELYLSSNDDPANKQVIAANIDDSTGAQGVTTSRQWTKFTAQKSAPQTLVAGQKYYLEGLHKESTGTDNFAIGWTLPGESAATINVIPGRYLANYVNGDLASLTLSQQPVDATVIESRSVTFSVAATGTSAFGTNLTYQWQKNGTDIWDATKASYTLSVAAMADNGAKFKCIVKVPGKQAVSTEAMLTVIKDNDGPKVQSAFSFAGKNIIGLKLDELLDAASANAAGNYTVSGATITNATLRPNGSVVLMLDKVATDQAMVTVAGVKDLAGNGGASSVANTVVKNLTSTDVGSTNAAGAFTDPVQPGAAYPTAQDEFEILAGGSNIYGKADGFHFVYREISGDFDARARISDLLYIPTGSSGWSKGGLMVRESLAAGSRNLNVVVAPTAGANVWSQFYRKVTGGTDGSASEWPNAANIGPVTYPNAWVRLTREGNTFSTFRSSDGTNWERRAQMVITNSPYPATVLVGAVATAHVNTLGVHTVAGFHQFSITESGVAVPPRLGIAQSAGNVVLNWNTAEGAGFTLKSSDAVGTGAVWTVVTQTAGISGNLSTVTIPVDAPRKYYRLEK